MLPTVSMISTRCLVSLEGSCVDVTPTQVHVICGTDVVLHFALTPVWRQNKWFNHVLPVDHVSDPDQPVILA